MFFRIQPCIETKDWSVGFAHWHHRLQCLTTLKYPMAHAAPHPLQPCAPLHMSWRHAQPAPVDHIPGGQEVHQPLHRPERTPPSAPLETSLPSDRAVPRSQVPRSRPRQRDRSCHATTGSGVSDTTRTGILLKLAHHANWSFVSEASYARLRALAEAKAGEVVLPLDPNAPDFVDEMLESFLPLMDGSDLDSVIRVQSLMVQFLPISQPQKWLPAMFRLWESFNSSLFTDQMLDLLSRLSMHHTVDPKISSDKHWKFRNGGWVDHVREVEAKRVAAKALEEQKKIDAATSESKEGGTTSAEGDVVMGDANDKSQPSEASNYDTDAENDEDDETSIDDDEQVQDSLREIEDAEKSLHGADTADPASGTQVEKDASKKEEGTGMVRDVGIFTTEQFEHIMTELLRSCG
ncbi:hypothetical protein CF336_g1776, partial [Tilletia laevis]